MNTMGYKMNNRLTNVMGNKFSNKMQTMGNKIYPIVNASEKYITPNIMTPNAPVYDKKIMPMMGMRQSMRKRLTK